MLLQLNLILEVIGTAFSAEDLRSVGNDGARMYLSKLAETPRAPTRPLASLFPGAQPR